MLLLHDALAGVQAEARARLLGREQWLEQPLLIGLGDTRAGVAEADRHLFAVALRLDRERALLPFRHRLHGLQRVHAHVEEDPVELGGVAQDRGHVLRQVHDQLHVAVVDLAADERDGLLQQLVHVHRPQVGLALGEGHEAFQEGRQAVHLAVEGFAEVGVGVLVAQGQLQQRLERRDDVGHIVGDAGRQGPDGREALTAEQLLLGLLHRVERLAHIGIQTGVLDGRGGLGRDGPEHLHVLLGEGAGGRAGLEEDRAEGLLAVEERGADRRAQAQVLNAVEVLEACIAHGVGGH